MDRALDEIVSERHRTDGPRGRRGGRRNDRNDYPRDGVRKVQMPLPHSSSSCFSKSPQNSSQPNTPRSMPLRRFRESTREDNRNIDSEWVHDKFDDNTATGRGPARPRHDRQYSPNTYFEGYSAKLRVENIHYDLTEEDLDDLFNRIGPVVKLSLTYDRAGRSEGVAYVTYETGKDAQAAIQEFDGANAKGQPIRLISIPAGPSNGRRNPFDSAQAPGRSLADRITLAPGARSRSRSPIRHSDVSGPPPSNVDRYVPSGGGRRSRSPMPRRRDGRRPGARRERGERAGGGRGGGGRGGERTSKDGRPKKTQEELDAEMEDYWGAKDNGNGGTTEAAQTSLEGDVDMIE